MKKLIVFLVMSFGISATADVPDIHLCVDREMQDASYSAEFINPFSANPMVWLFVPNGKTEGITYSAPCQPVQGADEFAITCNVMTSTDSGYRVNFGSTGTSEMVAVVIPWSMSGNGQPVGLPCPEAK
jgi:hypothetical protein